MATDSTDGPTTTSGLGGAETSDLTSTPTQVSPATAVSETPVPDDIAGAEGTDSASEQDATDQVAQASAITLIPKAGEWVVVRVEAGDKIALPFMLAGARGLLRDGNIEIVLPNGGVVVLQGYLAAVQGEPPLQLTDANGESVDLEDFIVAIDELEDLSQIALLQILGLTEEELAVLTEGGALQNISPPIHDGGASFTQEPSLTIVDGIEEKGALLATELSYGVPEIDDRETIPLDDDEEPGPTDQIWSIDGGESVVEGDNAIYTVSYTGASLAPGQTMTISVATSGGYDSSLNDAAAGSDYTALGTVLTFTGGSATSQTVAVSTIDDTVVEGSEDYSVTIDDQSVGTIGTSQSNTVITDDDETNVTWNITGSSQVNEGDTAQYTVSYTGGALAPGATALVTVATGLADIDPMDAIAGSDYTSLTTILTFTGGGVTQRTVAVSTIEDTLVEPTEDYEVAITASLGAVVTDSQHTNIVDDDATSLVWSITPGGLSIDEAEHDVATVSYTGATIAPGFTALVTVATGPGWTGSLIDAQANVDYTAFTTVLTFTSGTGTSQMIGISTLNDTLVEGTEDFTVTIGSVSSGTIGASQVNASIIDDDTSNLVWNVFGNSTVTEGSQTTYSVSYTGAALAPGITATITVATGNAVGAPPNATPGVDYTALSTVLTFTGGGVTQRTVAVSTIQDTLVEGTEDYAVIISNQSVGVVGTGQVNTHIADDDIAWSISPATASDTEGTTRNYTVSYSGAIQAGQTATITVATGNNNVSTFPNATAGADYTAVSTVLTFTSGTGTQRTVAVSTIQDTIVETTEDYLVTITGQSTGTVATSQANGTIADNDATSLQWNITGTGSLNEGATGSYSVSYTGVTLAPGQTQTITVATGDASANTITNATAGGVDYTTLNTVLTFTGGGATQKTVAVSTVDDTLNEAEEDYGVSLSGPSIGSIGTGSVTTVINFSDVSATFKVNEVAVGASVTAPGGVATEKWIELQNTAGTDQLSTGVNLEILGATGGIKTIAMPAVSVPAGGYLVIYEQGTEARYGIYNAAGTLQSSGAIAGGGGWNFGSDTSQRVGVNVFAGGTSFDLFIANGAGTGSFSGGASGWTSPGLTGVGFAAAAGLLATPYPLLSNQTSYNGQVDSQTALLQRLGLRSGSTATNNDVFLRGDTTDNSNGTDWTTATNAADTAGAQNNAAGYINPNDPGETITHSQATATAGEGQQFLEVTTGTGATLDGGLGHDFLYGNTGNDTLIGGAGDDFLFGHSGNDRLFGGPGGDVLIDVSGTAGNGDYMEGGSGHDILLGTYNGSANTVGMVLVGDVTLLNSSNGNDWIAGGNGGDIIIGDNVNFGGPAQTTFLNNPFAVGQGNLAFNARGGTGNDTVFGRGGSDLIGTSGGNDSVFGDYEAGSTLLGGNDTIATDAGIDVAYGGRGSDSINLGSDGDVGHGEDGNDTIDGEAGNDEIQGGNDDDLLFGSGGSDQIYGDNSGLGTAGNDTIFSGSNNDFAAGGSGDDLIYGEDGADWLDGDLEGTGASGNDTLHGGTQDDTLVGGPGLDLYGLDGSSGVLFDFANASPAPGGWQTMNLTPYGLGVDWFREMEGVAGSGGNDTINDGIGGGQYYQGGGGNDEYHDGEGQDTYDMSGGPADHDTLYLDAVSLTAVPNTVIGFGQSFDGIGPDTGDQDYISLDAIFDAFGIATVDRAGRVSFDDPPGFGPVTLLVDVDGPGPGTNVALIIFEGIGSAGGFTIGNSASDDIQVGTL